MQQEYLKFVAPHLYMGFSILIIMLLMFSAVSAGHLTTRWESVPNLDRKLDFNVKE